MHAIGIDLGTTSICGVLLDGTTGQILRSRTENSPGFLPSSAPWERLQDPEKLLSQAMSILEDLLREGGTAVIGVTGQMHGIVYTDRQGNAVSPLYTWQDGRGDQPYAGTTYGNYLQSHTGYGHVTDFYNRANGLIHPEAVGYCTIQDYLVMRLCGLTRAQIHLSNAASFGCYCPESRSFTYPWNYDTVDGYRIAGSFRGIPVSVAIGDNQASVFSCLADPDSVLVNIGTGSQVSLVSRQVLDAPGIETRPYFEDQYLIVGAALCGGRAYAMLKDFYARILGYAVTVSDDRIYDIMARMLSNAATALPVDTHFSGTREDPLRRGSIQQICPENFTPEALTLGFLEGMSRELWELYRAMDIPRRGLIGSGNGLRKNPALQQVLSRTFSAPLRIPLHTEEAACGAALYALVAAGHYENAAQVQQLIRFQSRQAL